MTFDAKELIRIQAGLKLMDEIVSDFDKEPGVKADAKSALIIVYRKISSRASKKQLLDIKQYSMKAWALNMIVNLIERTMMNFYQLDTASLASTSSIHTPDPDANNRLDTLFRNYTNTVLNGIFVQLPDNITNAERENYSLTIRLIKGYYERMREQDV